MITIIKGDLLTSNETIICHQTNCRGVMGAGLARKIRDKYPGVYKAYVKRCDDLKEDALGTIQLVKVNSEPLQYVCNVFGQDRYGRDKQYTDMLALSKAFLMLKHYCLNNNIDSIAMPFGMGCDLAGGNWNDVYKLLEGFFGDQSKLNLVIYKL